MEAESNQQKAAKYKKSCKVQAAKYKKTNENSSQARSDYICHEGSPGATEAASGVPQTFLPELMLGYYHVMCEH